MSIHAAIHHRTVYRYDRPVSLSPHVIRLRPAPHCRTPILAYSLNVKPAGHFLNWQQDPQANYLARVVFPEKITEFEVTVDLVADMTVINPFDFFLDADAFHMPVAYAGALDQELAPFRALDPAGPLLTEYLKTIERPTREQEVRTIDFLVGLNQRLAHELKYLIRLEPGVQAPDETLEKGSGSCRDFAGLFVQILRHLGFAARFVSGYLIQLTPDVKAIDGPAGPTADFTDLHAWTEVFLPGAGWVGLDATSGLLAGEGHIPLACSPEPSSAAAITGLVDDCECEFGFEMSVTRVAEQPRVTRPYSEDQWSRIMALGDEVDRTLNRHDVRLTMGGEPTFISIDDMDGAEWNTSALGPTKYRLAGDLARRLRARFAPGGLFHHGQGKWYPGEPLPRWALGCYWRKDGQPVWRHEDLVAAEDGNYGHTEDDARAFVIRLAERLALDRGFEIPAYEDAFYYLWKERRLPVNVDPFDSKLSDPLERERLARLFEQGLDRVVGYTLPLKADGVGGWVTGPWFTRAERMYLLPGNSPMGFRLPIDSLPWVAEHEYPYHLELDPFAPRGPLPSPSAFRQRAFPAGPIDAQRAAFEQARAMRQRMGIPESAGQVGVPGHGESAPWVVRTALCVEPRDGRLHVFLPPVTRLEDFLDLVAAIEDVAFELGTPLHMEGYHPPRDPRLLDFKVTPDPGVIEVNIHPQASWGDLAETTTVLYEEARQARLGTDKFELDGRHTGTGGGNHIVLGGATPADSPFLRRPDLLASMVRYWHNHPSLSYLFSGKFFGPTSQHPRTDEGRPEIPYELDIALATLRRETGTTPPWLVDRVLRNLLVDLTGNTHRTEFCIDKLYSPDSSSGRLGLVELRSFEMPPHARMSLAQQLLVRALIARFWTDPYTAPLARHGTDLHDRFMLPHFVRRDFDDVLSEMGDAGFGFEPGWFTTHFEFRFPEIGHVIRRDVTIELRQALEPWYVLGEESAGGGQVRYVDSSVERLQVKVQGLTDSRYRVACNGRFVPLKPTGVRGEAVAGVRYRAWQPATCLHPTIGIHAPLVFDLVDTWNERSVGGCTYHVVHPGGRAFDRFPVNANEAESRRVARFFAMGHTPGPKSFGGPIPASFIDEAVSLEFPYTLDLRRPDRR
jgi:uncharacterized protein (DUF2126 family)/transglutaminase-like putative cysteine protease